MTGTVIGGVRYGTGATIFSSIGQDGIRWIQISYRFNMSRSIGRDCIRWSQIRYRGIFSRSIGRYGSRCSQIRYRRAGTTLPKIGRASCRERV